MAQFMTIPAEERTETGKGPNRRVRREGRVPAVMYGPKIGNRNLYVSTSTIEKLLASGAGGQLIDVTIGGEKHTVLIKEVQRDPARGDLLHVDFHKVDLDTEVQTTVPLVLVGEDARENDGGFASQTLRELQITCLPTHIPEQIEVDISSLKIGDTLTVGDLTLPEGVQTTDDPGVGIVTIVAPRRARGEAQAQAAQEGEAEDADNAEEEA